MQASATTFKHIHHHKTLFYHSENNINALLVIKNEFLSLTLAKVRKKEYFWYHRNDELMSSLMSHTPTKMSEIFWWKIVEINKSVKCVLRKAHWNFIYMLYIIDYTRINGIALLIVFCAQNIFWKLCQQVMIRNIFCMTVARQTINIK